MEAPEQIEVKGLADYLAIMSKVAFQSGLAWSVIEAKWDGFKIAFDGFEPDKVAAYTPAKVDELTQDTRIVRNRRKIEATIHNAEALLEHRSVEGFRTWLRSHDSFEDTVTAMRKQFKFLGPQGIYHFLYVVGEQVPPHEEVF